MKTLFISDLHLEPKRADIQVCFDQFINSCLNRAGEIKSLFILGDLFEIWIGDDASMTVYARQISQLKSLTDKGVAVYIMHGNRDFLLGKDFEKASGCQLIPDLYHLPLSSLTANNHNNDIQNNHDHDMVLLSHGDIFCTDDVDYIKFRKMVRNPDWQKEFLSRSIAERIKIATHMREQSKQLGQEKNSEITDVNQQAIEHIMAEHKTRLLIHGHTHRPAVHEFKLKQTPVKRIVLPDWNPNATAFELKNPY